MSEVSSEQGMLIPSEPDNSLPKRKLIMWALVLVPVLMFGGNFVMDKITAALDGRCLVVDTNATVCVHRDDS